MGFRPFQNQRKKYFQIDKYNDIYIVLIMIEKMKKKKTKEK